MPKKKKNGPGAGRVGGPAAAAGDEAQNREEIVQSMQEMFSHLDPVVIYIVLSEADFKVENAMDALLELSGAAGDKTASPPLSGFEMAAALLEQKAPQTDPDPVTLGSSVASQHRSPEPTHLTEEIDQELDTLMSLQSQPDVQPPTAVTSLPLLSQPLKLDSDPKFIALSNQSSSPTSEQCVARGEGSPVNELSFGGATLPQESGVSVDFSHLMRDTSSRPSAFKAYRRPGQLEDHIQRPTTVPPASPAVHWNFQVPEFQPRVPVFITPVLQAPNPWHRHPFSTSQWLARRPVSQAPLKPSATVPKSWTLPPLSRLHLEGQVLVLLRGAPGSGKTTLARAMLARNPGGVVLSTDEYFTRNEEYHFEPELLGEAHAWNHQRAKEAFEKGLTPIIIDNTNMQCWEMKPYVAMALKHNYKVLFREPDTWWKLKPRELEKRTTHGVTKEKIRRMLENQDRYVTIHNIMASQPKSTAVFGVEIDEPPANTTQYPLAAGLSCPNLVGDSGFCKTGDSVPDGQKCSFSTPSMDAEECEIGSHGSETSLFSQENVSEQEGIAQSELLDGEELDRELDACTSLSEDTDTSEGPVLLEENVPEQPEVVSGSIAQRIRRERGPRRFASGNTSLILDSSVRKGSKEDGFEEDFVEGAVRMKPELLDFIGDWPSESLEQRGQWSRTSACQTLKTTDEKETIKPDTVLEGNLDRHSPSTAEFQERFDFLQGGTNQFSQGTRQDSLSLGGDKQLSRLSLPDCVLDRRSGSPTDSGTNSSCGQSPTGGLEPDQNASNRDASSDITTNDHVEVKMLHSKRKDKPLLSPTFDTTLASGGEPDHNAEVGQERRIGQSRRAGKACKLALTFTNQSPSLNARTPVTSPQLPILSPPADLLVATRPSASVQTDPQDFSLLWRIVHQKCLDPVSDNLIRGVVVMEGSPFRFVSDKNEEASTGQQEVPYRVCHEKGSQVEESDLRELPFKQDNLNILCRHFKHVPLETLKDLYEKCHEDMEWTTNLLLDSGERLYRDDVEDQDDDLDPSLAEGEELLARERCFGMTGREVEPKVDTALGQDGNKVSDRQAVAPDTNESDTITVSNGAGRPKDSIDPHKSDEDQSLDDRDQNKHLEVKPEAPVQEGSVEALEPLSRHYMDTHPDQAEGESRTLQNPPASDSVEPETEKQQALQQATSLTQRDKCDQDLDRRLAEWIEEAVGEETEEEDVDAIVQLLLAELEEEERNKEEKRKAREKERRDQGEYSSINIQRIELKLPTELALQLTELFGPVGISPGAFSPEDCSVVMDLNLARLLHQKWKETIQEKQRQSALPYHLLEDSADGYSSLSNQSGVQENLPFMDHWNVSRPPVSLRDIMMEEQVMQDSLEKSRLSRLDLDKKDGAAVLKEKQLFSLFPTIDCHFLRDIFRNNNYSLEQTEQFLHALLDDGPVKNVVAPGAVAERNGVPRAASKERMRKQKNVELELTQFQDTEDPEYEDFRTEAMVQRRRQQESFAKAAEAYRQGRKDVASFYAQQGRLHGQKMKEANHRAAVQIFERVNATLLPQNVLDLHGLHVHEALQHLQRVLADKTAEWQQGLCHPQLSVITGRGNRSQGGVARIRPAVLDYLRSQHYRYSEPKPGLMIITLH